MPFPAEDAVQSVQVSQDTVRAVDRPDQYVEVLRSQGRRGGGMQVRQAAVQGTRGDSITRADQDVY